MTNDDRDSIDDTASSSGETTSNETVDIEREPQLSASPAGDATGASDDAPAVEGETEDEARDDGDIAADFLEELLDIADIDGDLEIEERDGRMYVAVRAEGSSSLERLSEPDVVEAMQHITRLAVQAETGEFSRLILDIGGSRDARQHELAELVDRAIERLEGGASSAALPPMSSYERKLVHDVVAERGYVSESEGEGHERHTVIRPAS